mmetsp:Transcript_17377/g.31465  ORF Transcript_17377/g.31465 Transcript_17377/m.31465 type:complete len:317 (+) Transcript_17377:2477-3427(+)
MSKLAASGGRSSMSAAAASAARTSASSSSLLTLSFLSLSSESVSWMAPFSANTGVAMALGASFLLFSSTAICLVTAAGGAAVPTGKSLVADVTAGMTGAAIIGLILFFLALGLMGLILAEAFFDFGIIFLDFWAGLVAMMALGLTLAAVVVVVFGGALLLDVLGNSNGAAVTVAVESFVGGDASFVTVVDAAAVAVAAALFARRIDSIAAATGDGTVTSAAVAFAALVTFEGGGGEAADVGTAFFASVIASVVADAALAIGDGTVAAVAALFTFEGAAEAAADGDVTTTAFFFFFLADRADGMTRDRFFFVPFLAL